MNERPWMTALEMQFAACGFAERFLTESQVKSKYEHFAKVFKIARTPLRQASTYAWSDDTYSAVEMVAKTIPASGSLTAQMLPESSCWWWLGDTPYIMPFGSDIFTIVAVLIFKGSIVGEGDAVGFLTFSKPLNEYVPPVPSTYWTWRNGESYGDMVDRIVRVCPISNTDGTSNQTSCHARHLGRFVLAGAQWINQRIISTSIGAIERHRRKQIAREHKVPLPSDVKVIQLRRAESESRPSTGGEPVDWSCRWIVNGHWRNQPYKDERKLIYILPYVKGPDDKPLKVPTHMVYQVSR